uniref:Inactive ubiquitin carboxyl-terminal hydrolase 54 n=1 Tax=Cacopsylla melanoneura TaxID=428564 RepID=A0A8D8LYN2_9HEMI
MKDKIAHRTYRKRALFQITKVLWHLDIFRRSFRELSGHSCMAESCIFCALKELFSQLQSSHESALPPDALRRALAESFFDQQRFQLGFMDDAAECFENMLLRIHYHIAPGEVEDMCGARHCIPHAKFAMTLVEQSVCGACGATSEPLPFTQMVHYVSASALTAQARQSTTPSHPDLFGQLLKKAGGMGDIRDCPSACGAKIQIRRTLMNRPEIVSVGVVWDSDRPSLEHIMAVLGTLRTSLRLSDVFHGCDHAANTTPLHQLVGVVTYYGKHYSTFFFHTKLKVWIYFDDATVREVGPRWEQVVEKCRRGRYQPLLLLFAVPDGTSIDVTNAPKTVTMATTAPLTPSGKTPLGLTKQISAPVLGGRRSLTPSPEKPTGMGTMSQRRAVTPNPEVTNQEYIRAKTALMQTNEYQNLSLIQASIFNNPPQSSSANSSPNLDLNMSNRKLGHPERLQIQRRDSGNWSGDRNSASSSSSTSLENPYQYIVGKMQMRGQNGVPRSPTSIKPGELSSSSTGSNHGDAGYDSYSLSSTDSLPLQHLLKHNLQLAQIPEGHQTPTNLNTVQYSPQLLNQSAADDCERLCAEADQLLGRSEEAQDLFTALTYCNAAANKARAAMDAPYSNPQTASFARMKHNTCIMRARSLHRKLEEPTTGPRHGEGRHSREGSGCSEGRRSSGSHSRQNSKDKTSVSHSRQNSKELLVATPAKLTQSTNHLAPASQEEKPSEKQATKNIEIYATLPKNKKGGILSKSKPAKNVIEDEEYLNYERPGRTLALNRNKAKKDLEKRAKSEEKSNKKDKEFLSSLTKEKESKKAAAEKEKAEKAAEKEKKAEEKQGKKQHKIRRKLLMGGLIRRKNRSMPDLRDDELEVKPNKETKIVCKDDTTLINNNQTDKNLSGYLSEGHLEFSGNPNLERSKLMRKSFYGSKMIAAKVPPPPPLRTTSQLTKEQGGHCDPHALYGRTDSVTYANGGILLPTYQTHTVNTLVTEAQVHHENSKQSSPAKSCDVDTVDGMVINKIEEPVTTLPLPPYPSPHGSVVHSRQASEDFPPPPSLDVDMKANEQTFLEQLQMRKQQMLNNPEQYHKKVISQESDYSQQRQLFSESEILIRKQQNQQQIYQQQNQILTEAELRKQQAGCDVPPDTMRRNSASHMNYQHNNNNYQHQQNNTTYPQNNGNYHHQQQNNSNYPLNNGNYPGNSQTNNYPSPQSNYSNQNQHAQGNFSNQTHGNFSNQNHTSNYQSYQQPTPHQVGPNSPLSIEPEIIRKQQLLTETIEKDVEEAVEVTRAIGGETWLRELQAKQALLKNKRNSSSSLDSVENSSVKDLRGKFEQNMMLSKDTVDAPRGTTTQAADQGVDVVDGPIRRRNSMDEKLKPCIDANKVKTGKKKNVTFCEQVVLVATAEETEDDSYIPNPILERVLRSVLNKDQTDSVLPFREVTRETVVPLKRTDSMKSTSSLPLTATQEINIDDTQKSSSSQNGGDVKPQPMSQDPRLNPHAPESTRSSQDSMRLTQQSPVFSRPLTIPHQQQISTSLSSSPSNASPNTSLLRQSNPNTREQMSNGYYKNPSPAMGQPSGNPNQSPNYQRSYSPQDGGFPTTSSSSSIAQSSPSLQQRSNHLPYAQHLQNSTSRTQQQFQTKAIQQQTIAAGDPTRYSPHPANPSPNNTLAHSNSSSSLNSNQSNSSGNHSSSHTNYPTSQGYPSQNPPSYNYQSSQSGVPHSNQGTNQNPPRPFDSYQTVPHSTAGGNPPGYKPSQSQPSEPRTNGPYMPIPTPNGYHPSYQGQNGHNTGSLNSKMKQAMRPNPSVYQQNPTKNQRPQGVYQQDLALPEYNPPPPAPGSQKLDNGVYQKVSEFQRNGLDTSYPPYQKVPNLNEGPHMRVPPNTNRQDPYQRVPNPNSLETGTYQRVPNPNPSENGTYQRIPNSQDSYQRLPHDPYQRVPHPQDLNSQRGTPVSQEVYQRVPNPNPSENGPYQRVPNPNDQYQRVPNPNSIFNLLNPNSPFFQGKLVILGQTRV